MSFLEDFKNRGLFSQVVHEDELPEHLGSKRTAYIGFDPTADSLHVGHLYQVINLMRWQQHGHRPIVLVGGGTGYIGDPSGKTELRNMLTADHISENANSMKNQLSQFLDLSTPDKGILLNNLDWLKELNYLEFLRDFGPHFSVNKMMTAECYKARLETGLSFLEFNYMLLQSYDFYHLYKNYDCTIQLGGDDQWSNMLGGVALVRKLARDKAFCITSPLLLTSDGKKMGKTQKGAVWLDPNKTSPFDFFQYWRNVDDKDVIMLMKRLTFMSLEEIKKYEKLQGQELNSAKEVLAFEMTKIVHGQGEAEKCLEMAKSIFKSGAGSMDAPEVSISISENGDKLDICSLLTNTKITASKSEARRLVQQGGISLNGKKVSSIEDIVDLKEVKALDEFIIKKGKKKFFKLLVD